MKKKLLSLIGAALIAGSVIGVVHYLHRDAAFNANIEALSLIEEGEHGTGKCWKHIHAAENQLILFCTSCIYVQGARNLVFAGSGECE